MIIRFGATFPQNKRGIDYYRKTPQYDLCAVEAFNSDLVKGVCVEYPNLPENLANRYKIKNVTAKELILVSDKKEWIIRVGESLNVVSGGFEGDITYEGNKKLSNDLELEVGMELVEGVFTNSYQELLLSQAINAHFETEFKNFDRGYKVKTNTLFFIDSIKSYRENDGWLKTTFEKLLKSKLEELLKKYSSGEYHEFLKATLLNLSLCHGGYFAKDWGQADDSAIAEERDDILYKERTLPFKKADGSWNIRRFFFSKWTLREGWDNPNVFTICKLRTSGSEISKIQEVGRGLRLPVDEMGNRLSGIGWQLNFIIGWDEKDFAQKLINDINKDAKTILNSEKLTDEMVNVICEYREIGKKALYRKLDEIGDIIDENDKFQEGGFEKLTNLYPELLEGQVKKGKITVGDKKPKIKLRIENWNKIRDFWEKVSKRYMLCFEQIEKSEIENLLENALDIDKVFCDNDVEVQREKMQKGENGVSLTKETDKVSNIGTNGKIAYNEFVEQLSKRTSIPIQIVHAKLWEALQKMAQKGLSKDEINAKLNQHSCKKIIESWGDKFNETFATKYEYCSLNFAAQTSIYKNGSFAEELEIGVVGNNLANDIEDDKRNLYEKPLAYDSKIEHEVEQIKTPNEIVVFGKIPRRAIKVPTYTGGSTSPDFIYATQKNGKTDLTLLIETKAKDMRGAEKIAIEAQRRLFKNIDGVKWELATSKRDVEEVLKKFIKNE
jgi:type III restriction enzyme